jgi:hypothetical protein
VAQRTDYTNACPRLDLAAIDQLRAATSTHTPEMWPVDADRSRRRRRGYGGHFQVAMRDLHESDDLRVLDFNAERASPLSTQRARHTRDVRARRGFLILGYCC